MRIHEVLLVMLSLLLSACIVVPAPEMPGVDPAEPRLVFQEDFTQDNVGALPSQWETKGLTPEGGVVEVVEDATLESGRALRVATYRLEGDSQAFDIESPRWDLTGMDVKTLILDYKVKWVSGQQGLYLYVTTTGSLHRMIFRPLAGYLYYHLTTPGTQTVGPLNDGWNHVRVIADIDTQTATVYLNDMENPALENVGFQRAVQTWDQHYLTIRAEAKADEAREVYYAEFAVYVAD